MPKNVSNPELSLKRYSLIIIIIIVIHEFHRDASLEQNFRAAATP